jgi:hypothetical protein
VVNAVIIVERAEEGHALPIQRPVYYISEVLSETKARYPQIQKLLVGGYPKNSDNNPNTSRVLNTFTYRIRAQRD